MKVVNLDEKFELIEEQWRPKEVAALNGQEVKLVQIDGVFPWHYHEHEDELFMVGKGVRQIEFRDRGEGLDSERAADRIGELQGGELTVVPRGEEHRTRAVSEAEVMIFEPASGLNTGTLTDVLFAAPKGVRM